MGGKAIVIGGSIGGLFAAAALMRAGWEVDIYERTEVELSGRGAGIVTHPELVAALEAVGASTDHLGVHVSERVAFAKDGSRVAAIDYPQVVTSWDRMHRVLRALVSDGRYHLGRGAAGYEQTANGAAVTFEDGSRVEADLVVGADGFRSAIRAQMLPEIQPVYAGYVVWRALTAEADLSEDVRRELFPVFGFFAPFGTQIVAYPIAGPENDLRPGHRRFNFVWYARVPESALDDMLTDASGHRHAVSIPPPLVRDDVLAAMQADAEARLPEGFVRALRAGERPFFTPIYDHHSPRMADARVALAGDAACVARPHVGMGVTKAAQDALALARHVSGGDVAAGLQAYSAERVAAAKTAHGRARELGAEIFGYADEAANADGTAHPRLRWIMENTAVVPPEMVQTD